MMNKLCLLLLLLRTAQSIPNSEKQDVNKIIEDVFNQPLDEQNNETPSDGEESFTTCQIGEDCVPFYLCKNNKIVTDGEGTIDIRVGVDEPVSGTHSQKMCSYLETCCALEDKSSVSLYNPKPTSEGCGYRNKDGVGFKISGNSDETEYGEFPWMVAILKEEPGFNDTLNIYQCGGSLITPSVVLTAAHCVANKPIEALKVRAGEWDTQTKNELFTDEDRMVSEKVIHENFYKGGLFNDIALLFVSTPFELKENVQTVCLPPHGMIFDHTRCFATGWGKDVFGAEGVYQVILKKIDLPIVPNKDCQKTLRTTRVGTNFKLHESFICAGGELGKDTCKGDGGSPLVCQIPNTVDRYFQVGIVAWGIGCGDKIPGVYASVSYLRPWIDGVLAKKQITSAYFIP